LGEIEASRPLGNAKSNATVEMAARTIAQKVGGAPSQPVRVAIHFLRRYEE